MKKIFLTVLILCCCIGTGTVFYFLHQEPVYIAVVGPLGKLNGQAMRQGVELYREQINRQGGINGRKIKFVYQDDKNDPEQAKIIANTLAMENNVLAVLGHYYSSTSSAAGPVYKRNGIPVITATASADSVINDNEWYFRTIPGTTLEAEFVANYIGKALKSSSATIIFSDDDYGKSLAAGFKKTLSSQYIELKDDIVWSYDVPADEQLSQILKKLAAMGDPGIIYFAVHAQEGGQIITALKDAGLEYPLIASYAFARSFFHKLKSYPKEQEFPGYYSDGIYFVSPFMVTLTGVTGFQFLQEFREKYNEKPNMVSACYYDAAHIAIQAIKKSGIHGKKYIRKDRRNIRKKLSEMYRNNAVNGVTGRLWFDKNGGVRKEYFVGRWYKQKELPAFIQYDQYNGNINEILQGALDGEAILADGLVMTSTQIVHVNVTDLNILAIDEENSTFNAAFQLHFTYPADFDVSSSGSVTSPLEFSNVLSPIVLGDPVDEEIKDGIKTKVFDVEGAFRADLESGKPELFIRFRHTRKTYDNLVYVSATADRGFGQIDDGWSLNQYLCYSDILFKKTTLGVPAHFNSDFSLDYSRLNVKINIEKK